MIIEEGKYLIIFRSNDVAELESLTKIPSKYSRKYFLINNINESFTSKVNGKYYKLAQPKYFEKEKKIEKMPIDDKTIITKDEKLIEIISEN